MRATRIILCRIDQAARGFPRRAAKANGKAVGAAFFLLNLGFEPRPAFKDPDAVAIGAELDVEKFGGASIGATALP